MGDSRGYASDQTEASPSGEGKLYKPLDPGRREIRLLRITGGSQHGPVECSLETVSLDDDKLEFGALSYVCGDETPTKEVIVNGYRRAVSTNLEAAIRNFWDYKRDTRGSRNNFQPEGKWEDGLEDESESEEEEDLQDDGDVDDGGKVGGYKDVSLADGDPEGVNNVNGHDNAYSQDEQAQDDARIRNAPEAIGGLTATGHIVHASLEANAEEAQLSDAEDADHSFYMALLNPRARQCIIRRMRVGDGTLPFWVDALCINPDDTQGKRTTNPADADHICESYLCLFLAWIPMQHKCRSSITPVAEHCPSLTNGQEL